MLGELPSQYDNEPVKSLETINIGPDQSLDISKLLPGEEITAIQEEGNPHTQQVSLKIASIDEGVIRVVITQATNTGHDKLLNHQTGTMKLARGKQPDHELSLLKPGSPHKPGFGNGINIVLDVLPKSDNPLNKLPGRNIIFFPKLLLHQRFSRPDTEIPEIVLAAEPTSDPEDTLPTRVHKILTLVTKIGTKKSDPFTYYLAGELEDTTQETTPHRIDPSTTDTTKNTKNTDQDTPEYRILGKIKHPRKLE